MKNQNNQVLADEIANHLQLIVVDCLDEKNCCFAQQITQDIYKYFLTSRGQENLCTKVSASFPIGTFFLKTIKEMIEVEVEKCPQQTNTKTLEALKSIVQNANGTELNKNFVGNVLTSKNRVTIIDSESNILCDFTREGEDLLKGRKLQLAHPIVVSHIK